ncbi:hypothetical protein D3C77_139250 [compost metagenome]|jgi:hypothetical protein
MYPTFGVIEGVLVVGMLALCTESGWHSLIVAGGTLHQMTLLMTVDVDLVIQHIEARSEVVPTPYCQQISHAYAALKGLKVGPGFKKRVAERVGGIHGCTHLTELLGPMATTLIQTTAPLLRETLRLRETAEPGFKRPKHWVIDTCHAYRADGEAVQRLWPEHFELSKPESD